jgi:hypothetical protein
VPPAVALLNYISSGILWRIFCQTGIFRGVFSIYYSPAGSGKLRKCDAHGNSSGSLNVYKYGLWSQWDINYQCTADIENLGDYFFVFGQITLWAIFRDILRGPRLFWPSKLCARDNLEGQKSLGPLKISLGMAHKVICPQKKNNIPHFQNQRYINSYSSCKTL